MRHILLIDKELEPMGFFNNKILNPLVETVSEDLAKSRIGRAGAEKLENILRHATNAENVTNSLPGVISKSIQDAADNIGGAHFVGGIMGGGISGLVAGGSALTGSVLGPMVNNWLKENNSVDLSQLSPEAREKIIQIVRRQM